ncbi:Uncharacterised protein [uncultured archaeon]|nr:Uncharacterised protein [uncultured archaeon]
MSYSKDFPDILDYCIKIFDENMDILTEIEYSLGSELDDNLTPIVNKIELIDMAHEVSESVRLRKAESSFMQRHIEQDSN